MALPTGVTTCVVSAGSALDFTGQDGTITLTVEPVLGGNAKAIVWAGTGQALVGLAATASGDTGMQASVVMPHVDQPGFIDGSGNEVKYWSYRATRFVKIGTTKVPLATKVFQIVQGQTAVDLDMIPDGQITSQTSAPIPAVTSVNGQTGAVTVEGATDANVAGIVANGVGTKGALSVYERGINVKALGAKADGVTDDTAAFVAAHDALPKTGGKIFVPAGQALVKSLVTFTKTVIIEGSGNPQIDGPNGSTVLLDGTGGLLLTGASSGLRDLQVMGQAGHSGTGVQMTGGRPWAENLTVNNCGGHGLHVGHDTEYCNVNSGYFANIKTKANAGDGFRISHEAAVNPDANTITILGLDTGYNAGNGVTLLNCFDQTFIGLHSEGNNYNVRLMNAHSNYFLKPYIEMGTSGDFLADADCVRNYIEGHRYIFNVGLYVFGDPDNNYIMGRDQSKGLFPFANIAAFDKLRVSNHALSGYWEAQMDGADRGLGYTFKGSSVSPVKIRYYHDTPGGRVDHYVDRITVGGGTQLQHIERCLTTLAIGSIPANSSKDFNINSAGVIVTDIVQASPGQAAALPAGISWCAWANNAYVTIRIANATTAAIDCGQVPFRAIATRA